MRFSAPSLELEAHRELRLARIAYADAEEAVEVEELRRRQRVTLLVLLKVLNISSLGVTRKRSPLVTRPRR